MVFFQFRIACCTCSSFWLFENTLGLSFSVTVTTISVSDLSICFYSSLSSSPSPSLKSPSSPITVSSSLLALCHHHLHCYYHCVCRERESWQKWLWLLCKWVSTHTIDCFADVSTQEACTVTEKLGLDQTSERSIRTLTDAKYYKLTFCCKLWAYTFRMTVWMIRMITVA